MDCTTVASMITAALATARGAIVEHPALMQLHRARSRAWVTALAAELREHYREQAVRVFTQSEAANRPEFGRNEFLHDITVVRTALVPAPQHKKMLHYVAEVLWQVESEFARDGREALYDFNKLVLGSAGCKLFIMPDVHNQESFLHTLLAPAQACTGRVYIARVPHPDRWDDPPIEVRVWELHDKERWHEHEGG